MAWDLKPINPTADAPQYSPDTDGKTGPIWGNYNLIGWLTLIKFLKGWGVDVTEFSSINVGEVISAETCRKVADAIEQHLPELSSSDRSWLRGDIVLWRTCGGYEQL